MQHCPVSPEIRLYSDQQHPLNWSPARKNMTVAASVCTALIAAINVTSIALLNPIGTSYFGVSSDSFTLGITVNMVAIAIAPLFLAPLSEVVSTALIVVSHAEVMKVLTVEGWSECYLSSHFSDVRMTLTGDYAEN